MKTSKLLSFVMCFLCMEMLMPMISYANNGDDDKKEKKEKKKKEKKPYVWEMPKLTGVQTFDDYLLLCDTMNTKIKKYSEDIVFYEVAEIHVKDENGEEDIRYCVVDSAGNLRSSNLALAQNMDIVFAYPGLALDATNLTLATTNASMALASAPLLSLSHGKYLKAGPILTGRAFKEMKVIYKRARAQAKQIKALKAGKIDEVKALNAEVNAGDVEASAASLRVIEKSKTDYDSQLAEATNVDAEHKSVEEVEIPEETV
ncbi:MAG: hypothetical protein NC080_04340 [Paraprevotella sp.]|nr:hypothetical protein [Paraprevotella sp.]